MHKIFIILVTNNTLSGESNSSTKQGWKELQTVFMAGIVYDDYETTMGPSLGEFEVAQRQG